MDVPENQAFEFGHFVLIPKERLLLAAGKPVHLTAKAFDLLVISSAVAGIWSAKTNCYARYGPTHSSRK